MAGDWLQVQKATPRKPEMLRLAAALKCSVGDAFLLCFDFWSWCDDQSTDGNVTGVTPEMADAAVNRQGFCAALINVGWLRVRSGSLEVPHFDRYLSESAKKRSLSGRRQQKFRSQNGSVTPALPQNRTEPKQTGIRRESDLDSQNGGGAGGGDGSEFRIATPEFLSMAKGYERFCQLRDKGFVEDGDCLRALTLWRYARRQYAQDGPQKLRDPAAFWVSAVKRRKWAGGIDDENEARAFLANRHPESSEEANAV